MAIPSTQVIEKQQYGTFQEYSTILPVYRAYNVNTRLVDNVVYPLDATMSAVATGTIATVTTGKPRTVKIENRFTFGQDKKPLAYKDTDYVTVTSVAANDGYSFTYATPLDLSPTNLNNESFSILAKGKTNSVYTITIESSAGNDEDFTFTAPDTNWRRYTFTLGTGSKTGTINYGAVNKITVTGGAINDTLSIYDFASANNDYCFVGSDQIVEFNCLTSTEITDNTSHEAIMCFLNEIAQSITAGGLEMTLTTSKYTPMLEAMYRGSAWKKGTGKKLYIYTSENDGAKLQVSTGTFTIKTGLNINDIATININGKTLRPVNTTAEVTTLHDYHYNSTSGVVTVLNDVDNNGEYPTVKLYEVDSSVNELDAVFRSSNVGALIMTRISNTGDALEVEFPNVQITGITNGQETAYATQEVTLKTNAIKKGSETVYYTLKTYKA